MIPPSAASRYATLVAAAFSFLPFLAPAHAQVVGSRNMQLLAQKNDYPPSPGNRGYASCWAYVHGDGREYAAIAARTGTAIYNVTNPAATYLVKFVPGPNSQWRELKPYRNWIYVVTEGIGPTPAPGVQIIRMTDPENPVLVRTWTGTFNHSHSIAVDTTRALLFCNGTRDNAQNGRGLGILSIADPENPVELAMWPGGIIRGEDSLYVHDSVADGTRLFASSIYSGYVRVLDVTNPAAPFQRSAWTYPGGFTHNSWLDASKRYLYVTDEVNGEPLKIFDIANLDAPVLVNAITSNPQAIVHNAHVNGNDLVLANYTEGVRMLDLSDPAHPAEFASADSWGGKSGSYFSVWGVCPYYPSGIVIASDMQTGLYVYRPQRSYGIVRVEVRDAATNQPLAGVRVGLTVQGDSLTTPADGIVQFGPSPGAHTVSARMFGWDEASATVAVSAGSRDTIRLLLTRRPTGTFAGTIKNVVGGAGLEDAEIHVHGTPIHAHTDVSGGFSIPAVPEDHYHVHVHRPGYVPLAYERHISAGASVLENIALVPAAAYDSLESAAGWTVGAPGDNAWQGFWTCVTPLGTGGVSPSPAPAGLRGGGLARAEHDGTHRYPVAVAPYSDRTPGAGTKCFVTGQGTNSNDVWENSLYGGKTTLTSPALNLSGMTNPVVGYWRWFYSDGDANDMLMVLLSNDDGASWVAVDTLSGTSGEWVEEAVLVKRFVTPTSTVRIRFVAADLGPGTLVEAGIDDMVIYEPGAGPVGTPAPAAPGHLAFGAPRPNPSRGPVSLTLALPASGRVEVEVIDLTGRHVAQLHRGTAAAGALALRWDGRDDGGRETAPGIYYARARAGGRHAVTRFVRSR